MEPVHEHRRGRPLLPAGIVRARGRSAKRGRTGTRSGTSKCPILKRLPSRPRRRAVINIAPLPPCEAVNPAAGAGVVIPTGYPMINTSMLIEHPVKSGKGRPLLRLLTLSLSAAALVCVIMLSQTAAAADARYAQYYPAPPPGYGYVPPCQAVTRGPFRGAARGAAGGALFGAIGGNAGKGAAIGAGVGAVAGAVRRGTARASGACY